MPVHCLMGDVQATPAGQTLQLRACPVPGELPDGQVVVGQVETRAPGLLADRFPVRGEPPAVQPDAGSTEAAAMASRDEGPERTPGPSSRCMASRPPVTGISGRSRTRCPLLDGADAVLHGLDPALGIAAAICRQRPGMPVVAEHRRRANGSLPPVPEGCTLLAFPCSVKGQIDALWRELTSRCAYPPNRHPAGLA
jgi:hypothetical protein